MELLIPEEMSPISFRSSCLDSFFPAKDAKYDALITHFITDTITRCCGRCQQQNLGATRGCNRTTALLTFSVCFLHPCVLLLKVRLEVFEDLDFEVDGRGAVSQDAVVQGLHLRHKHLARMHDHKEA